MIAIAIVFALFTVGLEEGATFDGGVCWEADGTEGFSHYDGECITPADYDAMFSFEALDAIPSVIFPDRSIAEVAGITPDPPASERLLGVGLVAEPRTFIDYVRRAHRFL